jgi:hypothetical protein
MTRLYAAVQIAHLWGVALLFRSIAVLDRGRLLAYFF